jgi:hypothetical protein
MLYSIFKGGYGQERPVMWGGAEFYHRSFSPVTRWLFNGFQSILLSEMAGGICLLAETIIMIIEETLKGNKKNVQ